MLKTGIAVKIFWQKLVFKNSRSPIDAYWKIMVTPVEFTTRSK